MDVESYSTLMDIKEKFSHFVRDSIHKYAYITNSQNSTGDNMANVANCKNCFDLWDDAEDCKYCMNGGIKMRDSYDGYGVGVSTDLEYEVVDAGDRSSHLVSDLVVWNSSDVEYSINCHGSNNCFGCIGLRKKEYCILNTQYTKEEYLELLPQVKEQMKNVPFIDAMDRTYSYGEFFPSELSPFGYNETIAQEYDPLSKEDIAGKGFKWFSESAKNYNFTLKSEELSDTINEVSDSITKEIISCPNKGDVKTQCTSAYRITVEELELYRRLKIPLPRFCHNCRHYARTQLRNPLKLWYRQCQCMNKGHDHEETCNNRFETSYSPDRPEVVYCEGCYQKEII